MNINSDTKIKYKEGDVGVRVSEVAGMLGTRKNAAMIAKKSTDQMARYYAGDSEVPLSVVGRLCSEAKIRVDWVWFGEGEKEIQSDKVEDSIQHYRPHPAPGIVKDVVTAVDRYLSDTDLEMEPSDKGDLVEVLVGYCLSEGAQTESMNNIIRLVVDNKRSK